MRDTGRQPVTVKLNVVNAVTLAASSTACTTYLYVPSRYFEAASRAIDRWRRRTSSSSSNAAGCGVDG